MTSNRVICRCNACNGQIDFDASSAGQTISCPICAADTLLYIPGFAPPPPPLRQPVPKINETVFFSQRGVHITNTRFVVPGAMFPMHTITSIEAADVPTRLWPWLLALFGLFGLAAAQGFGRVIMGAIAAIGVYHLHQTWDIRAVYVGTAGGRVSVLRSKDHDFIAAIVTAVNEAIIHRG